MRKGNLIKLAAPAILSAAMMVSGLPVMGAEFSDGATVEATVEDATVTTDDFSADEFGSEEETPFVDEQQAEADQFSATAEETQDGYKYVYASLTWDQYWASEGVYNATNTTSSDEKDTKGETDKGGFDAVTRATRNHGLHRGSFQSDTVIYDEAGGSYEVSYWSDRNTIVLTDGTSIGFNNGVITKPDGSTAEMKEYKVKGMKYIPVAVKAEDYDAFKAQYSVVEDGGLLIGGFGEGVLSGYSKTANVTAETNGLKEAVKNSDGTFSFTARKTGSGSGIADEAQKTVSNVETGLTAAEKAEAYGAFIRADIKGEGYGDLGANMYAVKWVYYGNGDTPLATYGTKFAADNWMHKSMGIQLGLTKSVRCQLPTDTDGTGKWEITVYAMGYQDFTFTVNATEENLVQPGENEITTYNLTELVKQAETLKEEDYTAESWVVFAGELQEAKDELASPNSQATVNEAYEHLNAAMKGLVLKQPSMTLGKKSITLDAGKTSTLSVKTENTTETPSFKSSNTKVATVNKTTGKITAKAEGTTTITVTCGSLTETCKVTVKPVVTVSSSKLTAYKGVSTTLKATVKGSSKAPTFKSSNTKVLTVNKTTGKITPKAAGKTTITVTCGSAKTTCTVTVKNPTLTLTKSSASISVKKTTTIKAKATPSKTIKYKSSNTKVATVNSKGVVKGIRKGKATITVTCNGVSRKFTVTVK